MHVDPQSAVLLGVPIGGQKATNNVLATKLSEQQRLGERFKLLSAHDAILLLNKKFELMLTGRAKAYSSSCSQTASLSPAVSSRLLRGYRSLMPSCAGFLEPRKSRLGLSKSTFNAENFICSFSMSISIDFNAMRF